MESALTWTNFYNHPRFWRHAIPWIVVSIFLTIAMYAAGDFKEDEQFRGIPDVLTGAAAILTLIYGSFYAYNRLFKKEKKKAAFFVILILIVIAVSLFDHLFNSRIIQLGAVKGFWANMITYPLILIVAFGLKLAYHGSRQIFVIERLQAKQTESELKLLKSQVNPHFLFNTLNNVYSTNLEDHDKANEMILELSDLLRYQLESYKSTFTPLEKEIDSIENYIDLEKIRVRDCKVTVEKKGDFSESEIVPLLLLPFVENAFKYGTGIESGAIELIFELDQKKQFSFSVKNKIVQAKGKLHSGGIGLTNVKKRLELMYPNTHQLEIENTGSHFLVDLKIQL